MALGKKERKLWGKVLKAVERQYSYVCSNPQSKRRKLRSGFINIGLGGIIPDVIGIKDIGSQFEPSIEVMAVEVKENIPNYRRRHMDQVRRASAFSHRVYLAAPREFKQKEVELAVEAQIGLFELNTKNGRLRMIIPSPPFSPPESKVIELMRRLEFFKCTVCHCYWNKNLITTDGYRPMHVLSERKTKNFISFICDKCSEKLYELNSKSLRERYAEEWKLRRLDKRSKREAARIKKLASRAEVVRLRKRIRKQNDRFRKLSSKADILRVAKRMRKQDDRMKRTRRQLRESFDRKLNKSFKKLRSIRRKLKSI